MLSGCSWRAQGSLGDVSGSPLGFLGSSRGALGRLFGCFGHVSGRLWGAFSSSEDALEAEITKSLDLQYLPCENHVFDGPAAPKRGPNEHVLSMLEPKQASGEHAGSESELKVSMLEAESELRGGQVAPAPARAGPKSPSVYYPTVKAFD